MIKKILFLTFISLSLSYCIDNSSYKKYNSTLKEINVKCKILERVDSMNIFRNVFFNVNLLKLSSESFHSLESFDSLPKCIIKQIQILTKDNFRAISLNKPFRTELYCPDNPYNLPCRKIEYIGISKSYVIISYLQICKQCYDYANNILIVKHKDKHTIDLWVGSFNPYNFQKVTGSGYKIKDVNFKNSDTIINYIKDKLKNAPDELHILNEIVI